MHFSKVELCGVSTSGLASLSDEEKRELLKKAANGDGEARQKLIDGNIRLVLSILQRFSGRRENADDLFQVGCVGLIKAIDHFNTDLNVKFSTYAVPMIVGEIRRYLRDNNALRVSRSLRDLAYRSLSSREKLSAGLMREPTAAEIAADIGESERAVAEALEAIVEPVSIYESVYSDGEDSVYVIDKLCDTGESDEGWIEDIALREALKKLNEREKKIIALRYWAGKTQMEIAEEIGISQAQVSRLEKGALERMRREM
ncbi:MAG: RNA polymerase sporulation sigma factor SigG [Clostridia bacterium]|nr:RNA polymerase sporulation sigma factor SigG [Clostridia bacterium]